MNREQSLKRIKERAAPFDVAVIGGGATGVGCALDAASRGLDVVLLERFDFGKCTSSRSTKLLHGGVRYLEQRNVALVREALAERGRILKNAPEHVRKLEFVVPCTSVSEKFYYLAGLKLYDLLSRKFTFGKSRLIGKKDLPKKIPSLPADSFAGAVSYFDGAFDDSGFLIALARTASRLGATLANYALVQKITPEADGFRIGFKSTESGEEFELASRSVINAAGPFSDEIRSLSVPSARPQLRHSRGTHIVLDGEFLGGDSALMIPKTSDGRLLFAIPFYGKTLVGTTDIPADRVSEEPTPTSEEIDFLLETCKGYFRREPTRDDIRSAFAGIRPLVSDEASDETSKISREHFVSIDGNGMVTINGGKWTTYRVMAKDAVDAAVKRSGMKSVSSNTENLKIAQPEEFETLGLEQRLCKDFDWTMADVVRAVRFDMARTVEDVLARRTRMLFLDAKAAIEAAPLVAELIASELGRDRDWIQKQITEFEKIASRYLVEPERAKARASSG
ncbi:MAG: glycerol-3-phosphate dehydrogenase/oxidase [Pyrinomonadaceae bacterium]